MEIYGQEVKIEKGIPLLNHRIKGDSFVIKMVNEMGVGDSIFLKNDKEKCIYSNKVFNAINSYLKNRGLDYKFSSRNIKEEDGFRIWRIK